MRVRVARGAILAACLLGLTACETMKTAEAPSGEPAATGTVPDEILPLPSDASLPGENSTDDLTIGKKYYRAGQYGMAEQHFRRAVERNPKDAESWLGLAASYDRLKRFDFADRAYANAIRLVGQTVEILNNQGYSYLLRGDHHRARKTLLLAQTKDPANPYVRNNLDLLDESFAKAKSVQ